MLWIVVPLKAPPQAKSRLAGVLSDAARAELVERMARRTIALARDAAPQAIVILVSSSAEFRAMAQGLGAQALADDATGLNRALTAAAAAIPSHDAMLVLPADLPLLTVEDIVALVDTTADGLVAPDRLRQGTNALYWRRAPRVFRFGRTSFAAHQRAAREQGLTVEIIDRPGLAFDLDEPQDLRELTRLDSLSMKGSS